MPKERLCRSKKTKAEIDKLLLKYGAKNRAIVTNDTAQEINVRLNFQAKPC